MSLFLKWRNRLIAFLYDITGIVISWVSAYWLSYDLIPLTPHLFSQMFSLILPVVLIQSTLFCLLGLYRGVWRFASIPDLFRIFKAVILGTICIFMAFLFSDIAMRLPRSVPILYPIILTFILASGRGLVRWMKDYRYFFHHRKGTRVLIVGAGNAGEGLVRDLLRDKNNQYQPVVLVDDYLPKIGRDIHGIRVVGNCNDIPKIVEQYGIQLILIAIPSAQSAEMRRVVNLCEQTKLPFRTLPGLSDIASGRVDIKLLRDVSLEDLLGRDQVRIDWKTVEKDISNRIILISGGGGSIGSELCRQMSTLNPKQLIVVDNCEYNLYIIESDLRKKFPQLSLIIHLLDITDEIGIHRVFQRYRPDMVFHAAAYKHVPLLESQIRVAIQNNIIGTYILTKNAAIVGVKKFIFISTDKAVNPANLMGATKRAAEMICQNLYENSETKFITVRFGNVLDSAGSVVPLFRKQIQQGGPLTVTHPDITRYFMLIPEAAQLIVQAAVLGKGNEIFVLDMGEPINICYLAEQMIRLSGKILGKDIQIIYTGLRPGEKLYEELFYQNEKVKETTHHKIMLANAQKIDSKELSQILAQLVYAKERNNDKKLLSLLLQLVPEYRRNVVNLTVDQTNIHSAINATNEHHVILADPDPISL